MVDYVFKNTNFNQLTLSVFAFNTRAKKVYENIGLTIESLDHNELEFDEKWIDSINMKLERETWMGNDNKKEQSK
ncbi:GNAT family N-acetyltransferase [Alkalihalobacterium alkalinitrilicum]|uniref:GNAT family N-acetyltransferase n=1 Tax=Alkalihalobacterium alkalinitrilicum TaxID=427920 RepID=UPI001EE44C7F|nr:GNAT family protein [Alkalihalobacterium alkalinitrilicum]